MLDVIVIHYVNMSRKYRLQNSQVYAIILIFISTCVTCAIRQRSHKMLSPSDFKKPKPKYTNIRVRIKDYELLCELRDKLDLSMIDLQAYLTALGSSTILKSTTGDINE